MYGRRLRSHAIVLALCLWSVYTWNMATSGPCDRNGNLKGADFSHLYTLGTVGLEHRTGDLYDEDAQAQLTARIIPGAAGIRYIVLYPPQVSIFFAPLAALPYGTSLVIWLVASSIVYGVCCYMLWRACPHLQNEGGTVLLLAIAFPGFFHLIVWGQTSAIALACFTAAFFLLRGSPRDQRPFLAGLALGCLMFKPQLGIAAAFVFVSARAWRVIAGGVVSAAAQLALPAFYYGGESLRTWIRVMRGVVYNVPLVEPRPYQTLSLRTFWTMLVPGSSLPLALYVLSALVMLGMTSAVWTRRPALPWGLRCSSLLLASVLVAPHLLIYDVAVLAPVFLLLADWILGQPNGSVSYLKSVLYFAYLAPLAGAITRSIHLQISVVLLSVLVGMIWHASHRQVWPVDSGS